MFILIGLQYYNSGYSFTFKTVYTVFFFDWFSKKEFYRPQAGIKSGKVWKH